MAHFGVICPAASGHLNPMITLAHTLQQRGHRATVIGVIDVQASVLAAGLGFAVIGETEFPVGSVPAALAKLGQLNGLSASRYTVALFAQLANLLLREAPSIIKDMGMDALIIDQTSFGGATVADFLDMPFVSVCCALMLNREPGIPPPFMGSVRPQWGRISSWAGHTLMASVTQPITQLVAKYRRQWNLRPHTHPDAEYSPFAQLSQQSAEFEFPRQSLPACFHFTGPYINSISRQSVHFPFDQLTGQPIIYASLGTVQNRLLGIFHTIASACQHLDAQLVISLGGGSLPEALALPGSPLLVRYAPQLELLQQAALTITHAGMNTTLESLHSGVPMVAIPIANDQPGVAARIAWSGTGEVVPLNRLTIPHLRSAVSRVLTDESYRKNALRLQDAIERAGGVTKAADIIEQVAVTGKPVYRDENNGGYSGMRFKS